MIKIKKRSVVEQEQAEKDEKEQQRVARAIEKQDILTRLASSNAQGPLADIIRLIILENQN